MRCKITEARSEWQKRVSYRIPKPLVVSSIESWKEHKYNSPLLINANTSEMLHRWLHRHCFALFEHNWIGVIFVSNTIYALFMHNLICQICSDCVHFFWRLFLTELVGLRNRFYALYLGTVAYIFDIVLFGYVWNVWKLCVHTSKICLCVHLVKKLIKQWYCTFSNIFYSFHDIIILNPEFAANMFCEVTHRTEHFLFNNTYS